MYADFGSVVDIYICILSSFTGYEQIGLDLPHIWFNACLDTLGTPVRVQDILSKLFI
jgi:hypothetical protein